MKNIALKMYETDPYFYKHFEKEIQVDKNGCKYILLRIDIYFNNFFLAVEIDEKGLTDRDVIFEEKRQEALEKKLIRFIRIYSSNVKNGYDLDYDVSNTEAFIEDFKNKKIKDIKDKIKELEDKNKNSTTDQITNNFGKIDDVKHKIN